MKTLIVGGAGYIGSYITEIMNASVLDKLIFSDRFFVDVPFFYGDVRNLKDLEICHDYDCVIALAGIVGDAACAVDKQFTYDTNVNHVKWLADNFKGKIVLTSTCSVYGKNDKLLSEESEVNPLSIYAETKLEAEQYLYTHRPDSLIFRLGTLYGMSGKYGRPRLDLVVNFLTLKAVLGETLRVFGGDQWRPILHVRDVGEAIKFGIDNNITGLYNIGEENTTIKAIGEKILQMIPGNISYEDILFEDKRNYKVSFDKIKSKGWQAKHNFTDGVAEMIKVFKENRIRNAFDPLYHNGNYIKQHIEELK